MASYDVVFKQLDADLRNVHGYSRDGQTTAEEPLDPEELPKLIRIIEKHWDTGEVWEQIMKRIHDS